MRHNDQTEALLAILALEQAEIEAGQCRDVDDFLRELAEEDQYSEGDPH